MSDALTYRQAEALKFREQGLNVSEIAHKLGISRASVWDRLRRGAAKMGIPLSRVISMPPASLEKLGPDKIRAVM